MDFILAPFPVTHFDLSHLPEGSHFAGSQLFTSQFAGLQFAGLQFAALVVVALDAGWLTVVATPLLHWAPGDQIAQVDGASDLAVLGVTAAAPLSADLEVAQDLPALLFAQQDWACRLLVYKPASRKVAMKNTFFMMVCNKENGFARIRRVTGSLAWIGSPQRCCKGSARRHKALFFSR